MVAQRYPIESLIRLAENLFAAAVLDADKAAGVARWSPATRSASARTAWRSARNTSNRSKKA